MKNKTLLKFLLCFLIISVSSIGTMKTEATVTETGEEYVVKCSSCSEEIDIETNECNSGKKVYYDRGNWYHRTEVVGGIQYATLECESCSGTVNTETMECSTGSDVYYLNGEWRHICSTCKSQGAIIVLEAKRLNGFNWSCPAGNIGCQDLGGKRWHICKSCIDGGKIARVDIGENGTGKCGNNHEVYWDRGNWYHRGERNYATLKCESNNDVNVSTMICGCNKEVYYDRGNWYHRTEVVGGIQYATLVCSSCSGTVNTETMECSTGPDVYYLNGEWRHICSTCKSQGAIIVLEGKRLNGYNWSCPAGNIGCIEIGGKRWHICKSCIDGGKIARVDIGKNGTGKCGNNHEVYWDRGNWYHRTEVVGGIQYSSKKCSTCGGTVNTDKMVCGSAKDVYYMDGKWVHICATCNVRGAISKIEKKDGKSICSSSKNELYESATGRMWHYCKTCGGQVTNQSKEEEVQKCGSTPVYWDRGNWYHKTSVSGGPSAKAFFDAGSGAYDIVDNNLTPVKHIQNIIMMIGMLAAVAIVGVYAIQWMLATPAKKQELKAALWPLIIGVVLLTLGPKLTIWIVESLL